MVEDTALGTAMPTNIQSACWRSRGAPAKKRGQLNSATSTQLIVAPYTTRKSGPGWKPQPHVVRTASVRHQGVPR